MNFLIIKVKGLSMSPYFVDNDELIVTNSDLSYEFGSCYHNNGIVHRAINSQILKGDRLIYTDMISDPSSSHKVIGRIISKDPLKISNKNNNILIFLNFIIGILSKYNLEKNKFRYLSVVGIIIIAKVYRLLENFIIQKDSI